MSGRGRVETRMEIVGGTPHGAEQSAPAAAQTTEIQTPASPAAPPADGAHASGPAAATTAGPAHSATSTPTVLPPPAHPNRRPLLYAIGAIVLAAVIWLGGPTVLRMLNTVSTDDAYVNSHVTFVAPRVSGQVIEVLVDDNSRVKQGDTIVRLDPTPYQVIVDLKQAAYDVAKADKIVTDDQVRAAISQTRASRFKLDHAIEDVDNQVAQLRAQVAVLQTMEAKLARGKADYDRAVSLQKTPGAISDQDVDQFKEQFHVAEALLKQAREQVYQIRVGLGLPAQPADGNLTAVPEDLDQTFSTVRQAAAELMQNAAPLGVISSSFNLKPKEIIAEFYKRDKSGKGDLDSIYADIIRDAPAIKLAQAKVDEAKSDLDQANLNLSYCTVYAEIDGIVTRRDVNAGNNVVAGQSLMAIRSLTEVWVDANFKETQLDALRIGQQVDLEVDMYGSRQTFKGVITGFEMGTGATLALLPAENATGNFVKIVQRLPVRIDLVDYNPDDHPGAVLFVGLSLEPRVLIHEPLIKDTPGAGNRLRPLNAPPQFLPKLHVPPGETAKGSPPPQGAAMPEGRGSHSAAPAGKRPAETRP